MKAAAPGLSSMQPRHLEKKKLSWYVDLVLPDMWRSSQEFGCLQKKEVL